MTAADAKEKDEFKLKKIKCSTTQKNGLLYVCFGELWEIQQHQRTNKCGSSQKVSKKIKN